MCKGYFLIGQDNGSYFLDETNSAYSRCPKCGYMIDFVGYFNPFFKIKRKVYDISHTYDGRCIVSLRFKEFCTREGYKGLVFKEFERGNIFFISSK